MECGFCVRGKVEGRICGMWILCEVGCGCVCEGGGGGGGIERIILKGIHCVSQYCGHISTG